MKRVKRRGAAVAILAGLILALLVLFIVKLALSGGDWAAFRSNGDAYTGGRLRAGTVTDRNGVVLYTVVDGEGHYSEDRDLRIATLHSLGDRSGNIGTGALYKYADQILGYDFVNGLYSPGGQGAVFAMSLDAEVCKAAREALGDRSGAVFLMDYTTGEVLCAVSSPAFDPEDPPELSPDDTSGVYMNRALSAAYTPGSVFKLVTLAAAIENIDGLFDRDFHCDGSVTIGGGAVTCTRAHGDMKIEDALANSCNCVFGALAVELGGETLEAYARVCGLLDRHAIDTITTAAGRYDIPDRDYELAWSGAGQYNDLVVPASMARLAAAIAGGGEVPALTQVKGGGGLLSKSDRLLEPETAQRIAQMMDYNVIHTYGPENFPDLPIRAKSGTAEVGSGDPHAWFVGFLADDTHPYAFAVVVEHGGSGASAAGRVANAVLQTAVR